MGRCDNVTLLHKLTVDKIKDWLEVTFQLTREADNCDSINTRDYVSVDELDYYAMYDRPINQYDCDGGPCTTTGTLYVKGENANAVFFKQMDAAQFATGVMTMYVMDSNLASGDKVKVTISDTSTFANADVYEATIGQATGSVVGSAIVGQDHVASVVVGQDGFAPVLIDFSQTPTDVIGEGWSASNNGVFVKVEVVNGTANKAFGVSTIQFYKSMYDLVLGTIVKIGCLSEAGGTFDVAAIERTCVGGGYDENALSGGVDFTITGKLLTSNFEMLNPLIGMNRFAGDSDTTTGYRIKNVKKTVGSDGSVVISDINLDVCDFIGAQMDDPCVTPSADIMQKVSAPVRVSLAYDQYQVVNGENNATFYFNENLAGKDVIITYPQKVELKERFEARDENIGEIHAKMSYPWFLSDGTEEIHTFENVLITSFPFSITNEEGEFSFTINIQKDKNGKWFTTQRVLA